MTILDADTIEVPTWVCLEHRSRFREIAARSGEEDAASWARKAKAGSWPSAAPRAPRRPTPTRRQVAPRIVTDWTEDQLETISGMWKDGKTAAEITTALGGDVTRNKAIGRLRVLGLLGARRGSPAPKTPSPSPRSAPKRRAPAPRAAAPIPAAPRDERPTPAILPGPPGGIAFIETRAFDCRWIISQPGEDTRCCGAPFDPSSKFAFCEGHRGLALDARQPKRMRL